jgi:hypothetical protein
MTTSQSLLVTRHLQRQSVAILSKPACIWRSDERDRNTGALQLDDAVLGAWLAKESVRDVYLTDDPAVAAVLLDKAIVGCLADEVPEWQAATDHELSASAHCLGRERLTAVRLPCTVHFDHTRDGGLQYVEDRPFERVSGRGQHHHELRGRQWLDWPQDVELDRLWTTLGQVAALRADAQHAW